MVFAEYMISRLQMLCKELSIFNLKAGYFILTVKTVGFLARVNYKLKPHCFTIDHSILI